MTKKKSSTRNKSAYSKIKDPVKPLWMRVVKIVTVVLLGAILLVAVAGYMIRYYHHISNHK